MIFQFTSVILLIVGAFSHGSDQWALFAQAGVFALLAIADARR